MIGSWPCTILYCMYIRGQSPLMLRLDATPDGRSYAIWRTVEVKLCWTQPLVYSCASAA